jgi:hypothetical protein
MPAEEVNTPMISQKLSQIHLNKGVILDDGQAKASSKK